jgi:hypothetical protein
MTNPVGRTVAKFAKFQIGATNSTAAVLADIGFDSIAGVGFTYPEVDLTVLQDALKGFLTGQASVPLTITGQFDNSPLVTCSTSGQAAILSGAQTVFNAIVGGQIPLTFGVYVGLREFWTTGDPVFGIAHTATSGVICTAYTLDAALKYTAKLAMFPGSAAPAWGSVALA